MFEYFNVQLVMHLMGEKCVHWWKLFRVYGRIYAIMPRLDLTTLMTSLQL